VKLFEDLTLSLLVEFKMLDSSTKKGLGITKYSKCKPSPSFLIPGQNYIRVVFVSNVRRSCEFIVFVAFFLCYSIKDNIGIAV
jgi:hypothetical protein